MIFEIAIVIVLISGLALFGVSGIALASGDCSNDSKAKRKFICCFVFSIILIIGCLCTMRYVNSDSEWIEMRLKQCIEKYPQYADRCVIPVIR